MLDKIIPKNNKGRVDNNLVTLAEEIVINSASLNHGLSTAIIQELKQLQEKINTYHLLQLNSIDIPLKESSFRSNGSTFKHNYIKLYNDLQKIAIIEKKDNHISLNINRVSAIEKSLANNECVTIKE
ncbi:MAG: hypothetical protein JXQ76_06315 [Campylobacterales bacterium]|nr:hypothetical protein [Campylobacterales bacterium]